jgi:chemosensory pili system protein ChpA (sensor histidine kinase/response regulator)
MQLIQIPEQTPNSEVEEEILEVFVEEVGDILEELAPNYKAWKSDPTNSEALKTLRRCFHTLKGSGRLIGATVIGELGWRFEAMLNRVIDGTLSRNDQMLFLLNQVEQVLPTMVEQFQNDQPPPYSILLLISQADYFTQTKGQSLGEFEEPPVQQVPATITPSPPAGIPTQPPPTIQPTEIAATSEKDQVIAEPVSDNIFTETTAITEFDFITDTALEDTAAELELNSLIENPLENSLELETEPLSPDELELEFSNLTAAEVQFDDLTTPEDLESLVTPVLPEEEMAMEPVASETSPTETELEELPPPTTAIENNEADLVDPGLFEVFQGDANNNLSILKETLSHLEATPPVQINQEIIRVFHSLNGSSRAVNLKAIFEVAAPLETYTRALHDRQTEVTPEMLELIKTGALLIESALNGNPLVEEQQALLDKVQMSLEALPTVLSKTTKVSDATTSEPAATTTESVLDATDEFMAIFLEEAEEILENTQSLVERWKTSPHNMQLMKELQRELHTLKGGARMVGIAPMGDLSHHLESVLTQIVEGTAHSNAKLQDIVQNSADELAAMLEAVRSGVALERPTDLIEQINTALVEGEENYDNIIKKISPATPTTIPSAPKEEVVAKPATEEVADSSNLSLEKEPELAGEGAEDRIRVKVTLIDKLTNLAGELSIYRAHMEQQQGAVKNNLVEMEQTVIRLRDQLRRLEIETEAQILAHFSSVSPDSNEEFDPLELDRFSVIQQLSRSLMESVSDLLNIQDFLKILTRQSDSLLIQQTRIGAELQEGIMRTRMIPFARISPRLQRIARLTARELHKQIDFIINGENIEFERTVLNRVVAPLEHMLRNAIGHGIEDAPTRQQAGKPTVAKITIDLCREGSELIVKLIDDGAGLNLHAIRKKAEERELLKPDTVISDKELMQFILEPGFSTAKALTQTAGRGVGMDVVNTEIKQLSGSLQIHSKPGEGTTFEIRLPLSLTINQALMVYVGEETIAIPMNNIEAVLRAPREQVLGEAEQLRYYNYMEHNYRVFHLGELLGFGKIASLDTALIPMLLVRANDRRIALLVDGIEGSKEIVVKSVGPQISAIRWIAGATILGDGRVVLILDVPTLTLIDTTVEVTVTPEVEIVEEKPLAKTIMVVDDSITVRKVTARLLKRQGMEVLTAKDGVDAVAQLQEAIPDLMLLDVEMPRMDGYELATQVRNNPDWKHIPIIMITSRTGTKHRDRAEKIGINRYLGKPFNETELLENINALLTEFSSQLH